MVDVLKGHKTIGRLNPNDSGLLRDLTYSMVPSRQILTSLRHRDSRTTTIIKHIYNACHKNI